MLLILDEMIILNADVLVKCELRFKVVESEIEDEPVGFSDVTRKVFPVQMECLRPLPK